mmetsp:Transcript_7894/g.11432  ORF Transcript_7894/g.11432 Transcript_7894/m.11432 type:complete len:307 (-) Transcript_7894:102-1022(-)
MSTLLFTTTTTTTRRLAPRMTRRCFHPSSTNSMKENTVLVLGSTGALGSAVANHLASLGATVIGADIQEGSNFLKGGFVPLPHPGPKPTLAEITCRLTEGVGTILEETNDSLNAVVVASGGWEADPPMNGNDDFEESATRYGDSIERMLRMNTYPVLAAGHVVRQFIREDDGLFVVMGATAALQTTPGMMGYGVSKSAAHHYLQSYGMLTETALTTKAQRKQTKPLRKQTPASFDTLTMVGILPTMLDTPANREAMPDANTASWTRTQDIASEIGNWMEKPFLRPHSGSLVKVFGTANGAKFQLVR